VPSIYRVASPSFSFDFLVNRHVRYLVLISICSA
jgi:hypothetical protein